MAVGDNGTPLFEDLSGVETKTEDSSAPAAESARSTGTALVRSVSEPVALHRMHEGRVVRPAGRMLVGSPAPIPTLEDVLNQTPIFSGRKERRWRLGAGVVVVMACTVAIGAALALTGVVSRNSIPRGAPASDDGRVRGAGTPVAAATDRQSGGGGVRQERAPEPRAVQGNGAPQQRVAALPTGNFAVNDITGTAGDALPLKISVPRGQPEERAFLMFRNLPAAVSISSGFRLKDSWAVSLNDLNALTLQSLANYEGQFNLEVLFIRGEGTPAESRVIAVNIQKPGGPRTAGAPAGSGPQIVPVPQTTATLPQVEKPAGAGAEAVRVAVPQTTGTLHQGEKPAGAGAEAVRAAVAPQREQAPQISAAEEAPLLDRAAKLLGSYDVSSARLLFEHLAVRGSAKAALALGQTYDPQYFRTAVIKGMQPNLAKAKEWYKKAADLGNGEAAKRLSALVSRPANTD